MRIQLRGTNQSIASRKGFLLPTGLVFGNQNGYKRTRSPWPTTLHNRYSATRPFLEMQDFNLVHVLPSAVLRTVPVPCVLFSHCCQAFRRNWTKAKSCSCFTSPGSLSAGGAWFACLAYLTKATTSTRRRRWGNWSIKWFIMVPPATRTSSQQRNCVSVSKVRALLLPNENMEVSALIILTSRFSSLTPGCLAVVCLVAGRASPGRGRPAQESAEHPIFPGSLEIWQVAERYSPNNSKLVHSGDAFVPPCHLASSMAVTVVEVISSCTSLLTSTSHSWTRLLIAAKNVDPPFQQDTTTTTSKAFQKRFEEKQPNHFEGLPTPHLPKLNKSSSRLLSLFFSFRTEISQCHILSAFLSCASGATIA